MLHALINLFDKYLVKGTRVCFWFCFEFFFLEVRNTVMSKTNGHSGDCKLVRKTNQTQLSKDYKL